MTLTKTAMTVSSVAIALMFGGGVYLMVHMNLMAKNYIERAASQTLGVSVSIGELEMQLPERTAHVKSLIIGNPEGFNEPYAVKVENIDLVLGTVSKQLVEFKDIDVSKSTVSLEVRENITNLSAIRNRIKPPAADAEGAEPMKVIIDKITLSQAQIKPKAVLFTQEELSPVNVPDIVLTGIGRKENGVLVKEAIGQVWAELAHKLDTQAFEAGLLEGMSSEALSDMGLGFTTRFKENLKETVQEKVDTLNENINEMFNE